MRELSLFSGAGGGLLATQHLLGWRTVGYVENNEYCQKVIKQRIADGLLDAAPIFGDVRAFLGEDFALAYQGMVDVVTAGFPCQPFSVAGKRKGAKDERNMWPATARVIAVIRPRYVLLENVPGIRRYLPVVIRDLRRLGYTVRRPIIVAAASVGAGHLRRRVWIYAETKHGNYNRKGATRNSGNGLATVIGGRLNPTWCEWYMGFPMGWTGLQPLAMDRFRRWLRLHGRF